MTLRPYQRAAIDQTYHYLRNYPGNPCISLATGAGKSIVIAALCQDALQSWPGTKILKITARKELIQQNYDKLRTIWPNAPVGIYSASLNKRDIEPITFAGIQSIRNRAMELGHRDLIIIDEAHEISHEDTGAYRKVIAELSAINPALRVIGLTATPYRLGHGMITDKPAIFDALIEPTSILILQQQGFLAQVRSKHTALTIDTSEVHKRGGEYVEAELQKAVDSELLNEEAVAETIRRAEGRRAWLFFCSGVEHAYHIRDALQAQGVAAETVTGDTPEDERDRILRDFKAGTIRAVTNANILTTGFDYPDIDLIVMLRPTCSPGLYMQMVGRGLRIKSHIDNCLVLDFAGNVAMHGPIIAVRPPEKVSKGEGIAPSKICPQCEEMVAIQAKVCPCCGYQFTTEDEKKWKLHDDDISGQDMVKEMDVSSWFWSLQYSKAGKQMIVCRYYGQLDEKPISEYFCVFHDGFAGNKARKAFMEVSLKAGLKTQPERTEELEKARPPDKIRYMMDGRFHRIIERVWNQEAFEDEIPF